MPLFEISDELIDVYQGGIDSLINQLGKTVQLIYPPKISECTNCSYDRIGRKTANVYRSGGPAPFVGICPMCHGTGKLETFPTENITCLIEWNPKDYKKYDIDIRQPNSVCKVKTYASHIPKILKAVEFIIDAERGNLASYRCKLLMEPVLTGLQQSRYCLCFVELIDA